MASINLYIEVSIKGPKKADGHYIWILEKKTDKGAATLTGIGSCTDATENSLTLTAISTAFGRINKSASVRVFTGCDHVLNAMQNGHVTTWAKNDWLNAKGKPVKNKELWQQIRKITGEKLLYPTWEKREHEYSIWMKSELKERSEHG